MATGGDNRKRKKRTLTVPVDVVPEPVRSEPSVEQSAEVAQQTFAPQSSSPLLGTEGDTIGEQLHSMPTGTEASSYPTSLNEEKKEETHQFVVDIELTSEEFASSVEESSDETSEPQELNLEDIEEIPEEGGVPPKLPLDSKAPPEIQPKNATETEDPFWVQKTSADESSESLEAALPDANEEQKTDSGTLDIPFEDLEEIHPHEVLDDVSAAETADQFDDQAENLSDLYDDDEYDEFDEDSVTIRREPPSEADLEEISAEMVDVTELGPDEIDPVTLEPDEYESEAEELASGVVSKADSQKTCAIVPEEPHDGSFLLDNLKADMLGENIGIEEAEAYDSGSFERVTRPILRDVEPEGMDSEKERAPELPAMDIPEEEPTSSQLDDEFDDDEEPPTIASSERTFEAEESLENQEIQESDETEAEPDSECLQEKTVVTQNTAEIAHAMERVATQRVKEISEAQEEKEKDNYIATPEAVLVGVIQVIGQGTSDDGLTVPIAESVSEAKADEPLARVEVPFDGFDDDSQPSAEVEEVTAETELEELDAEEVTPEDTSPKKATKKKKKPPEKPTKAPDEEAEELDLSEAEVLSDTEVEATEEVTSAEDTEVSSQSVSVESVPPPPPPPPLPSPPPPAISTPSTPPLPSSGSPQPASGRAPSTSASPSASPVSPPTIGQVAAPPPPPSVAPTSRRKRRKPWWEQMFDDDYLRSLPAYSQRQTGKEVDFIEAALGIREGGMILDLACGNGRHAVELSSRGYQIVGLDLSLPMLARAAELAQKHNQKINFIHGDMRQIAFDTTFDGVCCLGTSFGYFDDETNLKVIEGIHRALKSRGMLIIEVANRDFLINGQPNMVWFEGDGCVCMEESSFNFITSRLKIKRTLLLEGGRQVEHEFTVRTYCLHELGMILHNAGFRVIEVSGHFHTPGAFFGPDSQSLIILSEKRA